jgi:hypothetical protein
MKYYKIGEIGFEYGINIKCVAGGDCVDCILEKHLKFCELVDYCHEDHRIDKQQVHFESV